MQRIIRVNIKMRQNSYPLLTIDLNTCELRMLRSRDDDLIYLGELPVVIHDGRFNVPDAEWFIEDNSLTCAKLREIDRDSDFKRRLRDYHIPF
jgi:hypothetical protein